MSFLQPKFKPAISTSAASTTRKCIHHYNAFNTDTLFAAGAPSNLPSFSTPGFRQPKPPPVQTPILEPIVISDYSNPPTPNALKRTSSDPDVVPDPSPQAHKRPKKTRPLAEKENLSPTDPSTDSKEAKSTFISRLVHNAAASILPDYPKEHDSSRPHEMEAHSDLMEVSPKQLFPRLFIRLMLLKVPSERLTHYKNKHHELLTHVLRLLLDGGMTASVDTEVLKNIRSVVIF